MPTYDFQCRQCSHKFTAMMSIQEKEKAICPKCGSKDVNQLFTGFGLVKGGSSCGTGSASGGLRFG